MEKKNSGANSCTFNSEIDVQFHTSSKINVTAKKKQNFIVESNSIHL